MSHAVDLALTTLTLKSGRGNHGRMSSICAAQLGRNGERRDDLLKWYEHSVCDRTGELPSKDELQALAEAIATAFDGGGNNNKRAAAYRARRRIAATYQRARWIMRDPLPARDCTWCDLSFTPRDAIHMFCSSSCRRGQHEFWSRERAKAVAGGREFRHDAGVEARLQQARMRRRLRVLREAA